MPVSINNTQIVFNDATTQSTAAVSWPGVYSGSAANNTAFPVGTTLLVNYVSSTRNNQTQPAIGTANTSTADYYINYLGGFAGQVNMAGTWVNRGVIRYSGTEMPSGPPMLVQRIA